MAVIIVEDGSIVADANSYVSEVELTVYASDRGVTLAAPADQLIIKSMDYIESLDYIGEKKTQTQPLQWPRTGAYIDGFLFPDDEIPDDLKAAQMALCVSIDSGVDPMATVGRATKKEKVDVIEVEYMDNASAVPFITSVNSSLSKLLAGGGIGGTSFNVVRV